MSTPSTYKAQVLAGQLRDALLEHFTAVSEVQFDTNLVPYVTVGSLGAGSDSACITVNSIQPAGVDGLGLTPRVFSPHNLKVVVEKSTVANVALMTAGNFLKLMGSVLKFGIQTDLYLTANTVVVGPAAVSVLYGTFDVSGKWKTMSSI